jgi:predicted DsbA family dithiol-disulfide isomerase
MVKLLTTHCPRCTVLKKKLDAAAIEYEEVTDVETIQSYGVDAVPALVIPNMEVANSEATVILEFSAAVQWVNNYDGGNQ